MIPSVAYLLSVAGIGISLTGFSGLVSAFRRGSTWQRMDSYRLRQIPEMGLATTLIALATLALADTTGNAKATIQILSGVALIFSIWHMLALSGRLREIAAQQSMPRWIAVGLIDLIVIVAGAVALGSGAAAAYEWLLVARPADARLRARAGRRGRGLGRVIISRDAVHTSELHQGCASEDPERLRGMPGIG